MIIVKGLLNIRVPSDKHFSILFFERRRANGEPLNLLFFEF
jgi:hypothetical protein